MVAGRLTEVRERVAAAAARVGRPPEGVRLVAVSKTALPVALRAAYDAGQRDFGENRASRLLEVVALLPGDARWHFLGRLQGNKVARVRPVTHLLHSLDRPDLAGYWVKGPGLPPPVLIQVNVAGEAAKGGGRPGEAESLVEVAAGLGIEVRGLMAIPPLPSVPEDSRPHFRELAGLRSRLAGRWPGTTELSMGMTEDFEVAVEEGATLLRIGRAIFGPFPESGRRE